MHKKILPMMQVSVVSIDSAGNLYLYIGISLSDQRINTL